MQNELARAQRERQPVAVLLIDLDRFKLVNDTHGHLVGDAVLREATQRMQSAIRRYDSVGRYGGEEFLVVLPGCSGAAAGQQAERIREAVARSPFLPGGDPLPVTCSIGVAWRNSPSVHDADHLIRESDIALYRAKDGGRNRIEAASPVAEI